MWVALLIGLTVAATDERLPLHVRYEAPPDCPDQRRFERELLIRTAKVALVGPAEKPEASLDLSIKKVKRQYVGRSSLSQGSASPLVREFKGAKCESVAQAMSLSTALLLDPQARTTPVTEAELVAAPMPAVPVATPEPLPPPSEPVAPAKPETPPVPATAPAPAEREAPAGRAPSGFSVAVSGGASWVVSGQPEATVGIDVAFAQGYFGARLTPLFSFGRSYASSAGTASWRAVGGRFAAGARVSVWRLELEPMAAATVLAVPIRAVDAEESVSAIGTLASLGPQLRLAVKLGSASVGAVAGLGFHLRRERYAVLNQGLVFQAPALFPYVEGNVGWAF